MDLRELTSPEEYEVHNASQPRAQFLQSWAWGQFQHSVGRQVRRYGFFDRGHMIGTANVLIHRLPFGRSYWYVPRGPVVKKIKDHNEKAMIEEVVKQAREAGAMFVRVELPYKVAEVGEIQNARQVKSTQPQDTLYLDLSKSETELLAQMHEKTRYNIRLAQKKGVTVRKGTKDDLVHFWRINQETTARDEFASHSRTYYEQMFSQLPEKMMYLYLAEFEGRVIAANLVIHYGDTATYLHGASSNTSRNVMAPHLLQWQQIVDAQKAGMHWYDFWGVAPEAQSLEHKSVSAQEQEVSTHPWAGITRFKKGFGGEIVHFTSAVDIPIKPLLYTLYTLARRFR